jgi:transglutaminase-like putative cysteine protease
MAPRSFLKEIYPMLDIVYRRFLQTARREVPVRRLTSRTGILMLALVASAAGIAPPLVTAGHAQTPSGQKSHDAASYTEAWDDTYRFNADRTGEILETRRIKVLSIAAVDEISQQTAQYIDGIQSFDIVEAFTQKADGTKVPVDPATVVTGDAVSGLEAVFKRGAKIVTVIFPNVAVGDTLVMTTRTTIHGDTFTGHFEQTNAFWRSTARADSTIRVIAPSSVPLRVGVQGEGVQHTATVEGAETRHLITLPGSPAEPAEDRATSYLDRDPAIFISTFASYEEIARSYWDVVRGAIEVTPEIARLAGEVTQGIADRRAQARAISSWISANVKYVGMDLGAVHVEVHNAPAVLKNRYGDGKDIAVLASALLAARGIAAEHVLLNSGNAYTLPEPATMGYLNDVILYLPEFGIYADPASRYASFGDLAQGEYDKPVIRVSGGGVQRARTSAARPEDHVTILHTRLSVSADGAVSGESEESGTGIFAIALRSIAASAQVNGLEESAEAYLRSADTPGKGRFEIGSLTELGESYSIRSRFAYDEHLDVRPSADLAIPLGLSVLKRPGEFVFGSLLPARHQPFTCFAGTQIEEVDLTFADGLPLPQKIEGHRIEAKYFIYTASYRLEGRTLKVRHEFVSRVPGQVCAPELAAGIAQPLHDVSASNDTHMMFAAATPAEVTRVAFAGQQIRIGFLAGIEPDCSASAATVRIVEGAAHGEATLKEETGFTSFAEDDPRFACNKRRSSGTAVFYRGEEGYAGKDSVTVKVVYADGRETSMRFVIEVK